MQCVVLTLLSLLALVSSGMCPCSPGGLDGVLRLGNPFAERFKNAGSCSVNIDLNP